MTLNYLKYIQSFDVKVLNEFSVGAGIFWGRTIFTENRNRLETQSYYSDDWDYGFSISMSYNWSRFSVRASYFHSASTVQRSIVVGDFWSSRTERYQYKHRTLQLMVSYNFMLGEKVEDEEIIEY